MSDQSVDQRLNKLEIDSARIQEQYTQIMKTLAEISGQLSGFNNTFIRRDLCEQTHKANDREQYDFRHGIEKRIFESDAMLKSAIEAVDKKVASLVARVWAITLPIITGVLILIVRECKQIR